MGRRSGLNLPLAATGPDGAQIVSMSRTPDDPDDWTKDVRLKPTEEDADRMRYLHGRLRLRGAVLVRQALLALEKIERRREAAEKAVAARTVRA